MYKILKIGGVDYKLEYTLEASLYEECIEKLFGFYNSAYASTEDEETSELTEEERRKVEKEAMRERISSVSNIPSVTLSVFYAGLLEHHGTGLHGDKTVRSKEDAKNLVRQYFIDHEEDNTDNFYDLFTICMEQMEADNFLKRIGLSKIGEQNAQASTGNREQRRAAAKASSKQS